MATNTIVKINAAGTWKNVWGGGSNSTTSCYCSGACAGGCTGGSVVGCTGCDNYCLACYDTCAGRSSNSTCSNCHHFCQSNNDYRGTAGPNYGYITSYNEIAKAKINVNGTIKTPYNFRLNVSGTWKTITK